jgi:hypothetical protein
MLLATLALGGAILGATTIAGILILYQIRATTDSEHSAQAIFAADAGVEWALFDFYCTQGTTPRCVEPPDPVLPGAPPGTLANGAVLTATCYDATGVTVVACSNTSTAVSAITRGTGLNSRRAFFLSIGSATGTLP